MSYTLIEDQSMLFDDSKIAIIPLDKNFEPKSKEGSIFTSIYSCSYKESKRNYLTHPSNSCFMYPTGKDKYILYIIQDKVQMNYLDEVISLLNRYMNNCRSISILADQIPYNHIEELSSKLRCSLKVYPRALMV